MKSPVYFEITVIATLVVTGCMMLALGLPGTGLLSTAALLAVLTVALRVNSPKLAKVRLSIKGK